MRGLHCDLVYSPGINALDADVITVHIVFHEFYRRVRSHLRLRGTPIAAWPRLVHRQLYYRLLMALERNLYPRRQIHLAAVSDLVALQLRQFFGRTVVRVIRNGVSMDRFSPSLTRARRAAVREEFHLCGADFVLLLIGNDWKKKGLDSLLHCLATCRELPLKLLVVGSDERIPYLRPIRDLDIMDRVLFLDPSPDVVQFYAAADAYVGPSLEDAYGLPILEAMACGLPVIASVRAGASEIISDGENGLLLRDPEDFQELAALLRRLCADASLRLRMGEAAAGTAAQQSWDCNAAGTWELLNAALAQKRPQ